MQWASSTATEYSSSDMFESVDRLDKLTVTCLSLFHRFLWCTLHITVTSAFRSEVVVDLEELIVVLAKSRHSGLVSHPMSTSTWPFMTTLNDEANGSSCCNLILLSYSLSHGTVNTTSWF
jgi:hypothetical protein